MNYLLTSLARAALGNIGLRSILYGPRVRIVRDEYAIAKMSIIRILSPTVHIMFATDSSVQKTVSYYFYFLLIRRWKGTEDL